MIEFLRLHQRLYNGGLEERIDAYKKCGVRISFKNQCKSLTQVRSENPEYSALNAQSEQVTLKRLSLAFDNFFRRLKEGKKKAGFPRFKALSRYKGWGYKAHGDGWRFKPGKNFVNGTLIVSGIGNIQIRGRARYRDKKKTTCDPGIPKTMEIFRKGEQWFASVTFETPKPHRVSGDEAIGIDWGTSRFMTIVNHDEKITTIENPRYWNQNKNKIIKVQKNLSRKKKGSQNREKSKRILRGLHQRLGWKRENFLHQTSSKIIKMAKIIGVEDLNIKGMTAKGGRYKSGLNRSILDTAPGTFFQMLEYKAEEAGITYVKAPTRKLKPSQTCHRCGKQE
jgi:putative transposase